MILKPFGIAQQEQELQQERELSVELINDVLETSGLPSLPSVRPSSETKSVKTKRELVQEVFARHQAGPEDIAKTVGYLIKHGENETIQLNAAKIAMQVQGWLTELEKSDKRTPDVTINIIGTNNKSLINLVMPTEFQEVKS